MARCLVSPWVFFSVTVIQIYKFDFTSAVATKKIIFMCRC